jgi:hypothetical protein
MSRLAPYLCSLLLALTPVAASAQTTHDHAKMGSHGPNGGKIEHAGATHLELVIKDSTLRVYLYDEDMKPTAAQGTEVTVTVQVDGKRETVKLLPTGSNVMEGKGSFAGGPGLRAVVAVKLPGKPIVQARFAM